MCWSVKLQADPSFVVAIFGRSELKRDREADRERFGSATGHFSHFALSLALSLSLFLVFFMLTSVQSSAHFSHAFCPFSHLFLSFHTLVLGRVQITIHTRAQHLHLVMSPPKSHHNHVNQHTCMLHVIYRSSHVLFLDPCSAERMRGRQLASTSRVDLG